MSEFSQYTKYAAKAYKGQGLMDEGCSCIYNLISPMLNFETDDAHVFIQEGDGLVLCWNNNNTPTTTIIDTFLKKGEKLNEEDLKTISI